jgi:hypothetical protein
VSSTAPPGRTRQLARVVRLDSGFGYCSFQTWCAGQILVRVPLDVLTRATGLVGADLRGAEVSAQITVTAVLEEHLDPLGWLPAEAHR